MTFSRNFWFLNGYRLTSYLKLMCVSNWSPPIVECHIAGLWNVSKERKMTLQNHPYIRQLFQELMKYFQASIRLSCWLFFINQGLTNSVHSVPQLCAQCTQLIYSCVRQKIQKPKHLCMPFSLLHIALSQLSVLGFACFFHITSY